MKMEFPLDDELRKLLLLIQAENKSEAEWAEIESGDMFQTKSYCGGFDAIEMEFCFSYYSKTNEYWFQFSLDEVNDFLSSQNSKLSMRLAPK
jgi:hypothetical protein